MDDDPKTVAKRQLVSARATGVIPSNALGLVFPGGKQREITFELVPPEKRTGDQVEYVRWEQVSAAVDVFGLDANYGSRMRAHQREGIDKRWKGYREVADAIHAEIRAWAIELMPAVNRMQKSELLRQMRFFEPDDNTTEIRRMAHAALNGGFEFTDSGNEDRTVSIAKSKFYEIVAEHD